MKKTGSRSGKGLSEEAHKTAHSLCIVCSSPHAHCTSNGKPAFQPETQLISGGHGGRQEQLLFCPHQKQELGNRRGGRGCVELRTRRGVIGTSSPVFGLRPMRAALSRIENVPKDEILTLSPSASESDMCVKTLSTKSALSLRDRPTSS